MHLDFKSNLCKCLVIALLQVLFLNPAVSLENLEHHQFLVDYFGDILPETFQAHHLNKSEISWAIDDPTLKILKTSLGLKLCKVLNANALSLENYLGLSAETAQKAVTICQNQHFVASGAPIPISRMLGIKKQYWLALVAEKDLENSSYVSWTTISNNTLIISSSKEFNQDFLLRAILHEIAISFDSKASIDEGYFEFNPSDKKNCDVLAAINYPLMKASLATVRALTIELKILRELGLKDSDNISSLLALENSCRTKIEKVAEKINSQLRIFLKQDSYFRDFLRPFCRFQENLNLLPANDSGWQSALEEVSNLEVLDSKGKQVELCDHLVEPELDRRNIMYSSGPKPRVIGGW